MRVEAELTAGVWTDLGADVLAVTPLRLRYGIDGHGPQDRMAGPGELSCVLRNDAGNSGGVVGYYSPAHTSCRSGWGFGVGLRVAFVHGAETVFSVATLTRASQTATVTTSGSHGRSTDDWVLIAGATEPEYNGVVQITVTGATTFTYTVVGTPATPATGTITSTRAHVKFRGHARTIAPEAGVTGTRRVLVTAYDGMRDLIDADVRELAVAVNTSETGLLTAVVDAVPVAVQPYARSFDTAVDVYPYVFDDLGTGAKAAGILHDLVTSAFGWLTMRGDGTLCYRSRATLQTDASLYAFSTTLTDLSVPSSTDRAFNRVRVTVRPRRIDATPTTVLWTQLGTPAAMTPNATVDIWATYTDPADRTRRIGGTDQVTTLVAGTDYVANTAADGSGTVITSSVSVVVSAFASSAKFTVTNTGLVDAYLTTLQLRGKGVYDDAPVTLEASSVQDFERPLSIDCAYQDDVYVAQAAADYYHAIYSSLTQQIEALAFMATVSDDALTRALRLEPGDRVTVTETVTGLVSVEARVTWVELEVLPRRLVWCRLGLAPVSTSDPWQLGTAGLGELDSTTMLGF